MYMLAQMSIVVVVTLAITGVHGSLQTVTSLLKGQHSRHVECTHLTLHDCVKCIYLLNMFSKVNSSYKY